MKAAQLRRAPSLLTHVVVWLGLLSPPAAAAIPPGALMPREPELPAAPPPPAPPPLPLAPTPAAPRPSAAPAAPFAPFAPFGSAAPAAPVDPAPPPPPGDPSRRTLPLRGSLVPHFAFRLGEASRAVSPPNGYGLAGTIEVQYLKPWRGLEVALGIDFGFDRFATSEQGAVRIGGQEQFFAATRVISETTFVLLHSLGLRLGAARPYVSVGAGLGLGYFESFDVALRPGTASDTHLLGRISAGVDVAVTSVWAVTIRADYTAVRRSSPFMTEGGRSLPLFGDVFALGPGISYRF